jgi:DNA-binding transcriptional LysR family regulator
MRRPLTNPGGRAGTAVERTILSGIDLNLVVALHALLRERNVTRAAKSVGLGQSSMSHALARLRAHFGDPLLSPAGRSLVLTERARALIEPVNAAVRELSSVFAAPEPFDPRTSARVFQLAATDNLGLYVLPRLSALLAREAPLIDVRVRHLPADWTTALEDGTFDLKLGRKYPVAGPFHAQDLFVERFACVVRRDHPLQHKPTLRQYAALSHVVVALRDDAPSQVDRVLAEHGLARRVAMTVPHFLVAPFLVAESDLVLTAPERLVARFVEPLGLRLLPLPLRLAGYSLSQVWSERSHADEGHRWLREAIARAAGAE